jgi:hypothetical protein
MKNTARDCQAAGGAKPPKSVNRQHIFNKEGDQSLPKINYYVAYEKIQPVNFRAKLHENRVISKRAKIKIKATKL